MFGEFNKLAKLDTFLYDPKFGIAIANSKKNFDKFFVKFTLAIMPLDFTDCHKISNL